MVSDLEGLHLLETPKGVSFRMEKIDLFGCIEI